MKQKTILYVGNIVNHGTMGAQWGGGLLLLLSEIEEILSIDLICPKKMGVDDEPHMNEKVRIIYEFDTNSVASIILILRYLIGKRYNFIIFNSNPTYIGNRKFLNLVGQLLPIFTRLFSKNRVILIRHSSSFTNDARNLGFSDILSKIGLAVLKFIEMMLFNLIDTYFLLDLYNKKVKERIKNAKVHTFQNEYFEAIPSVYLNFQSRQNVKATNVVVKNHVKPVILLHGFWGPQKNLDFSLSMFYRLSEAKHNFDLIVSGPINLNVKGALNWFNELMMKYGSIVSKRIDYVMEKDILKLFAESDLVVLPYSASGGQSGVLEISSALNIPTLVRNLPEFLEKSEKKACTTLVSLEQFYEELEHFILTFKGTNLNIEPNKIITVARQYVMSFLKEISEYNSE